MDNWKDYPQCASYDLDHFKWWKFPSKILHTNITTQKAFPKTSRHKFWHVCVYSRYLVNHFGRYIFIRTPLLLHEAASNLTHWIVILCTYKLYTTFQLPPVMLTLDEEVIAALKTDYKQYMQNFIWKKTCLPRYCTSTYHISYTLLYAYVYGC